MRWQEIEEQSHSTSASGLTQKVEVGRSLSLKPTWSMEQVSGHTGLHWETWLEKKKFLCEIMRMGQTSYMYLLVILLVCKTKSWYAICQFPNISGYFTSEWNESMWGQWPGVADKGDLQTESGGVVLESRRRSKVSQEDCLHSRVWGQPG